MPKPNTYTLAGITNANAYTVANAYNPYADADGYSYGDDHTSSFADADTIGNPASADAEAAAHAVPTADAVSEWDVKRVRK